MASFGKKRRITDYLYSRPVLVILGILVVFLSVAVYARFTVEREMAQRKHETEQKKAQLMERKNQLEQRVEYLSGERGIEEEIRKHFDVAKEGEQVIIIVGEEEKVEPVVPIEPKKTMVSVLVIRCGHSTCDILHTYGKNSNNLQHSRVPFLSGCEGVL